MVKKNNQTIILGIDPGFAIAGYSFIAKENNKLQVIDYGVVTTDKEEPFTDRLKSLNQNFDNLIKKYQPDVVAIEDIFFYKNAKTAIKVGEARGAIILTALQNKLPVYNFTPLQVKQAVATYGRAEKKQIQKMVKMLLNLKKIPQPDDAADALAVAYCCAQSLTLQKYAN